MMIERFSKEEFERALTYILWSKGNSLELIYLGLVSGEYEYHIPLPPNQRVNLVIRSSIDSSGYAAEAGADSIRVWLVDPRNDEPIGNKAQSYITRVPGWQGRLGKVMRELAGRRMKTGDCHVCYAPVSIYKVKKDTPNRGRLFGKCTDCGWWWGWLDKPDKKAYFKKGENDGNVENAKTGGEKNVRGASTLQDGRGEISSGEEHSRQHSRRGNNTIKDHHNRMQKALDERNGIYSGDKTHQRGKSQADLSKLSGSDDSGGLTNGKTDTANDGGEDTDELRVSLPDSATPAEGRQDGANGLPEERDGEGSPKGENDRGTSIVQDVSRSDDGGGGLNFLAKDSPTALVIEGEEEEIIEVEDYPPTPEQQAAIEAPLDKPVRVLAGPGSGKCLAPGTPVLLFSGTVIPVEKIKPGMQLMGPDSQPRTVLSIATGWDTMYEITPTKGESYTVNAAHILSLKVSGIRYGGNGMVVNISITDYLELSKRRRHHLKGWRTGVDFDSKEVMIDPYFLGLWLGDGHTNKTAITTKDPKIVNCLKTVAKNYRLRVRRDKHRPLIYHLFGRKAPRENALRNELKHYGLLGNKHIPYEYKCNNRRIRLEILAGLLDSDGYEAGGYYEITQKVKRLATDIVFLSRSLGFAAYMTEKVVNEVSYWRVTISGNISEIPVRLERKKAETRRQKKDVLKVGIQVRKKECGIYHGFELDGDGLFLLGDFTVTHNTFLLTHRYKHLVENGVNPRNILAVTFTKEMANALGSRILAMCPEAARGVDQICTIHAICYRILKAEGDNRSVPKWWEIKKAIDEAIDDVWPMSLERPGYKDILSYINSAKAKGLQPGQDEAFYSQMAGAKLGNLIARIRKWFDDVMRLQRYLTFADMLLDVETKLRENDTFRHRWQSKFHYVLVDESQDTSGQAMRILTTLAEPQNRFHCIGDADQLLFRFAGATPEANLYDGFEKRYPGNDLYKLTTNWRSTKRIVDAQLRLIRHNYEDLDGPYESRYIKELQPKPDAVDGDAVSFQWYGTPEEEALGVAGGILEDMTNGYKPADFFIASRTRAQTAYIEGSLVRAGIQYINLCGGSFWTLKHVQDVVSYVRLAYDQNDDKAFQRVYNIASSNMKYPWGEKKGYYCPHRYLGRAFLDACGGSYSQVAGAVKKQRSFGPGVDDLVWFVNDLVTVMATETVADVVGFILDHCYLDHLKAEEGINARDEAEDGKAADLATVKDIARSFGRDVEEFLSYVNEMIEAAERARQKDWSEHVVISTVHRLKGLERKVVYGIGWCEGVDRLGFPVGLLPHTFSLRPPPQNGVLPVGGQGRIEDERCIAFVCISRAMEKVRLSGFQSHMMRTYQPSRFVKEALGIIPPQEPKWDGTCYECDNNDVRRVVERNDGIEYHCPKCDTSFLIDAEKMTYLSTIKI